MRTATDDATELRRHDLAIGIGTVIAAHLQAQETPKTTTTDVLAALEIVRHHVTEAWIAKNPGKPFQP